MSEQRANLVALPHRRVGQPDASGTDVFCAAAGYLDELSRCLDRLLPHATWSAQQWKIASTPYRMRLVGARRRLRQLAASSDSPGQAAGRWMLEIADASTGIENRIRDLDDCLRTLQHENTSGAARARETDVFLDRRSELAQAAARIRNLLERCSQGGGWR